MLFTASFDISTAADAICASRILARAAEEMSGEAGEDIVVTANPPPSPSSGGAGAAVRTPRGRRTTAATTPDPVAAYNTLAAAAGAAPVVETPAPEPVVEQPAPAEPAADTRTREQLLAAIRETAMKNGALWLRPILQENKADKLSDLSDDVIRAKLAESAALA